ncbi:MAG: GNAT family N-acetyltransferase [Defluviitaleaceae bacterium]|nr:GNAT family N-acetyltransferase [Defluviitaleaceae bacterium]
MTRSVFLEYAAPEYSEEGVQEFMRFIEPPAIMKMLSGSIMRMWICECGGEIIGTLAANNGHIFLLFVNGRYHGMGIARRLIDIMIEQYNPSEISVNSSPYAVEAYHRLGFVDNDSEQLVNGMRFTPMRRELHSENKNHW